MNSARSPPSARSTASAPGPRRRSANTGTASRSARTLSAAAVLVSIVSGTGRGSLWIPARSAPPRNLDRWSTPAAAHRRSVAARSPPSSMPCASVCSCSTVRSAPGCRATTSAPTTSAASRSRAATRTSCSPGPTSSAQMHAEFFEAGVDAVETATFGAFPLVLNEYQIPEKTFEINQRAARDRQGGRVRRTRPRTGRGS